MDVVFSCTNAFCKYLNIDPPGIPSPDGKRIGIQPIQTTQDSIAWQCHAIKPNTPTKKMIDVIVVEACSRYAILFSNPEFQSIHEFIPKFRNRWPEESVHMAMGSGATTQKHYQAMLN